MNHKELIERLRVSSVLERDRFVGYGWAPLADEAADMIEAVIAERDEYQQAADKMAMEHKVERDTLRSKVAELEKELSDTAIAQQKSSNARCNHGRNCGCLPNSYKANFDHLGNPVDQTPLFRISDLIIICIAVLGTVALLMGVV